MKPTQPATYWEEGARRILGDLVGRHSRHAQARKTAAQALLAEFAKLAKEYGVPIHYDPNAPDAVAIGTSALRRAYILIESDGWLTYTADNEEERRIPLNYDPITQKFEGIDADPDRVAPPGSIQPRRDALAVLALMLQNSLERVS